MDLLRAPKSIDELLVVDRLIFGPPCAARFSTCADGELKREGAGRPPGLIQSNADVRLSSVSSLGGARVEGAFAWEAGTSSRGSGFSDDGARVVGSGLNALLGEVLDIHLRPNCDCMMLCLLHCKGLASGEMEALDRITAVAARLNSIILLFY
jgi:hypothetical protein